MASPPSNPALLTRRQAGPGIVGLLQPVNALLMPLIKAGFGNPFGCATGLTVLEVKGRKSGTPRSTPLTCLALGSTVIVATVRGNAQWLKNLAAAGEAGIWLWGRRRPAQATVFMAGDRLNAGGAKQGEASDLSRLLRTLTRSGTISIAVLELCGSSG
jgi:deazaflavin-dependent oxidoreductase (nitroreductase family)